MHINIPIAYVSFKKKLLKNQLYHTVFSTLLFSIGYILGDTIIPV